MFEIAEKLGSFSLLAPCKDAASSETMLPPCGTGKNSVPLQEKKIPAFPPFTFCQIRKNSPVPWDERGR